MENLEKQKIASPVSNDAICRRWPMYEANVRDRLLIGAQTYGDKSFIEAPDRLIKEILEELMDVSGWAFILWCRMQDLQEKIYEQRRKNKSA